MPGIVIGIASVILLTALGEGTRQQIVGEFGQFGTNLLSVSPGRVTTGGMPSGVGATIRKLTIEDAQALQRVPGVERVIPVELGLARVTAGERARSVFIYGVTADVPAEWKFQIGQGRFLPESDPHRAQPLAVLGPTLKRELFGDASALGRHVDVGGQRVLVIGVRLVSGLRMEAPPLYIGLALAISAAVGVAAGVLPARRAARLDPVGALRTE